jgi:uncharacterized protein Veg
MEKNSTSFFNRMNSQNAEEIKENLYSFLNNFQKYNNNTQLELSKKIQDKITELIELYIKIFNINLEEDENGYEEICDGFENIITKKLFNYIFSINKEDIIKDYNLDLKIRDFSFIKPEHLEIKTEIINDIYIETAINSK